MGFIPFIAAALALATPVTPSARYCDPASEVCYSSSTVGVAAISFRVALPIVDVAPFDLLLQIVAPKTAGWAGIAWGGHMINNTIGIGWANGTSSVVSSRWASAHSVPDAYDGAAYTLLEGSISNDTHWTVNALCKGCSVWSHDGGSTTSLDPGSLEANFAWAASPTPPFDPADNSSVFGIHTEHGTFTLDLAAAKSDQFDAYVQTLSNPRSY
ncbi:hypothetical protein F4779DRAFT_404779 [Xylariaceae sp. FL0662B]|nr:hypothetical protein F4779DRAFT_404779 [Xylariaceae sp. FL0662B]